MFMDRLKRLKPSRALTVRAFNQYNQPYQHIQKHQQRKGSDHMAANAKGNCSAGCEIGQDTCCCKVDALISVDERGQMVLPKDIREKAGIKAGDKLAQISTDKNGKFCCISLIKVENLSEAVTEIIGPGVI